MYMHDVYTAANSPNNVLGMRAGNDLHNVGGSFIVPKCAGCLAVKTIRDRGHFRDG